jgi:hypothetical protein
LIALCLCFCTLHTNEILRTDPSVQVDYVRVVDLDIGASKSDNLRDQSAHHPGARLQNWSLQPRVRAGTAMKTLRLPVVPRLIAKEQHQGRVRVLPPLRRATIFRANYDLLRFRMLDISTRCRRASPFSPVRLNVASLVTFLEKSAAL